MPLDIKSRQTTYRYDRNQHVVVHKQRRTRRTIAGILLCILLLIVAGLVYTWYVGRYQPPAPAAPIAVKPKPKAVTPTVDENARVGVSAQMFTDKVVLGKNASVSIKTNPLAACSIRVEYNKQPSTDGGLVPKKADEYGIVAWTWTVETAQPVGTWPVTITCANAKNSGMLRLDLVVSAS